MAKWWKLGPISKQLRTFLWSSAPVHYKVNMMACESVFLSILDPDLKVHLDMFSYCVSRNATTIPIFTDRFRRRHRSWRNPLLAQLLLAWIRHRC